MNTNAVGLMDGNEAIAYGAIAAGCRFFAGYPITPATSIFHTMLKHLPPIGGICLQGEDEIASIGCCLGASMTGMKVMTATSGPGISLYSEQISFAIAGEIPIVIVDVQRLGPSTGSATRGADGDIQFLRWGNSGGLPVIVLAPVDVMDCYILTVHAFNLSEQYRCPVFIASNKEIGMTRESLNMDAIVKPELVNRRYYAGESPYLPFATPNGETVPDFLPIGGTIPVRQTSSTHGSNGYITIQPDEIDHMIQRLSHKIDALSDSKDFYEFYGQENPGTLIVAYGVTVRAAKSALKMLHSRHLSVSLLVLKMLWPLPEALIREKAGQAGNVIVIEMNSGQYVHEIRRVLCGKNVDFFGQMNGKLIQPNQIVEVIRS